MKDCNCIFCKIANGEIPSTTLYEDEDFRGYKRTCASAAEESFCKSV